MGIVIVFFIILGVIGMAGGLVVYVILRKLKQSRTDLDTVLARYMEVDAAREHATGKRASIDGGEGVEMSLSVAGISSAAETTTAGVTGGAGGDGGGLTIAGALGRTRLGSKSGGGGYGRVGGGDERDE